MKDIVIVVDMQKGFARYDRTQKLTEKIADLLDRKVFDCVIATKFLNDDNSTYENLLGWHRLKTDEEQEIAPAIMKNVDYVFDKYIYNAITPTFVQKLCQANDGIYPEKIYVIGADTDCCVLTIATALFENNIRPIVLTNYCDSNGGEESHIAGITCMKRLIGSKQLVDFEINSKVDLKEI